MRKNNRFINYVKSCVFDQRKLNLVHVRNVVSAIEFLMDTSERIDKEVFIISDDEYDYNTYRCVEKNLMEAFGYKDYQLPRARIPSLCLSLLLRLAGKTTLNPYCTYDSRKILATGFKKPLPLKDGLESFVTWYKNEFCSDSRRKN